MQVIMARMHNSAFNDCRVGLYETRLCCVSEKLNDYTIILIINRIIIYRQHRKLLVTFGDGCRLRENYVPK
jgi:hypothetical protein